MKKLNKNNGLEFKITWFDRNIMFLSVLIVFLIFVLVVAFVVATI